MYTRCHHGPCTVLFYSSDVGISFSLVVPMPFQIDLFQCSCLCGLEIFHYSSIDCYIY